MKEKIQLSNEAKEVAVQKLKSYFFNELETEIGDLAAVLLLDFFIENIGPEIYNTGINEAIKFMNNRIEDMYALEI